MKGEDKAGKQATLPPTGPVRPCRGATRAAKRRARFAHGYVAVKLKGGGVRARSIKMEIKE